MSVKLINPETLAEAVGFAHVAVGQGRAIELAGQVGWDRDGRFETGVVAQFERALGNILEALRAAGGAPEDLARLRIFVLDVDDYRAHLKELGRAYKKLLGRHYPAMSLVGVKRLFDEGALLEIEGVAYVD
ncbi:MAG: RidA family protein [Planctomycetota bacterium]|jgi:enamine deaminase RidA (YjgF/YER057c/UK114 family)